MKPEKTTLGSSRRLPKITLPPNTTTLSSIPEGSSDEEPEGLLAFTPVEPETTPSNSTLAEEPVTNPEFPQETSTGRPHTHWRRTVGRSDERPTRQRRPPTLLTYDTLGTPAFHHPAVPSSTSYNAGMAPLAVPILPRPLGGIPNAWLNSVWPMVYSMPYGHVGVYPSWIS